MSSSSRSLQGLCSHSWYLSSAFMLSPIAMKLFCLHNFSWFQQAYLSILSNLPVFRFIESWRITRAVSKTRKKRKIIILWAVCDQIQFACWCLPKIEMFWPNSRTLSWPILVRKLGKTTAPFCSSLCTNIKLFLSWFYELRGIHIYIQKIFSAIIT